LVGLVILLTLTLSAACLRDGSGDPQSGSLTVARGAVGAGDLTLSLSTGVVSLSGGADDALELEYRGTEELEPRLDQRRDGDRLAVSVAQPTPGDADDALPGDSVWTAQLADDLLWDVSITTGSAKAEIDLDTVRVRSLALTSDSGDAVVGLSGAKPDLRSVNVSSTAGEIWLDLEGNYGELEQLSAATTAGALTVVLLGQWQRDVSASLSSTAGRIAVHVPPDVAVRLTATTASGAVFAGEGFRAAGSDWVSGPEDAAVTLTLRIATTSGEIAFRVDERVP
jgi:hypothetical protein